MASVLLARFFPKMPALLRERLTNTAELLIAVESVPDPALMAGAHLLRGRTALEAGDMEEADRCFEVADRLSAGLGQPALRWRVLIILIGRAIVAGQFPKAERLLAEYRELGHLTGQSEAEWVFAVQLSCLRLEQGRLDREVLSLLDATARDVDVPLNDSLLAVAACEVGEDAEARAALNCQTLAARFDLYELLSLTNVVAVHLRDTVHVERLAAVLHLYAAQAIPFAAVPTPSVATSAA